MKKDNLNIVIKLLIGAIILVSILLIVNIIKDNISSNTYLIKLKGNDSISIYEGDSYLEYGYQVYDVNNNLVSKECEIENNVNINTPGNYTVVYKIDSLLKKNSVTRTVIVLDNPLKEVVFNLNGNISETIDLNTEFNDPGYTCLNNNQDCSSMVKVESTLNNKKLGNYSIKYTLTIGTRTKEYTRNVTVVGDNYSYNLDNSELTNNDVNINFISNINENEFSYIIDPNNNKVYLDNTNYLVSENGDYNFVIVKKNNSTIDCNVKVENIDKEPPKGTCEGTIDNNVSKISISSSDESGIEKYVIDNIDYLENSITINKDLGDFTLTIYDKAGNSNNITCNMIYSQKVSNVGSSIVTYSSDTLKYDIRKKGNFKIAYIWVQDPYNQLKSELGGNPTGLKTTYNIMTSAINTYGYTNKGLVAVNGSGFTNSTYDSYFSKANSGWYETPVIEVLINNGVVIRDYTTGNIPKAFYVYGLDKNNKLRYYNFQVGTDLDYNKNVAKQIVDDGVKYTYGFCPIFVANGKAVYNDSSVNTTGCKLGSGTANRTSICQIDKNNYVLYSTSADFEAIANQMISDGCITGLNLDGGGSRSLHYKLGNGSLTTLNPSSRPVADAVYFVEK